MDNEGKDPAAFADALAAMTDEEVFASMDGLEQKSEQQARTDRDIDETLALIALIETEIGRRFPGQGLLPYKEWKRKAAI